MAKAQRRQYGVDRIEDGGWVVREDGDARTFPVPRGWSPADGGPGQLLHPERETRGGDRRSKCQGDTLLNLKQLGISGHQSSRWQALALVNCWRGTCGKPPGPRNYGRGGSI